MRRFIPLFIAVVVAAACVQALAARDDNGWRYQRYGGSDHGRRGDLDYLGSADIGRRFDRDTIKVSSRERYRSILVRVEKQSATFYRVVVKFRRGDPLDISMREFIREGRELRRISLPGRDRVIREVTLWYKSANPRHQGKALIYGAR